jgi:hypothetical protein
MVFEILDQGGSERKWETLQLITYEATMTAVKSFIAQAPVVFAQVAEKAVSNQCEHNGVTSYALA